MSQAYICDTCQTHEEPDKTYNLPPAGWYTVYRRVKAGVSPTVHFCSPACLTTAARKDLDPVPEPAPVEVSA